MEEAERGTFSSAAGEKETNISRETERCQGSWRTEGHPLPLPLPSPEALQLLDQLRLQSGTERYNKIMGFALL